MSIQEIMLPSVNAAALAAVITVTIPKRNEMIITYERDTLTGIFTMIKRYNNGVAILNTCILSMIKTCIRTNNTK